jgi:hypothetical protein
MADLYASQMIQQEHVGKRGGGRSGSITHDRHFFLTGDIKRQSNILCAALLHESSTEAIV